MEKYLILILLSCVGINGQSPSIAGSYWETCKDYHVVNEPEGKFLRAICQRGDKTWPEQVTSLNLRKCPVNKRAGYNDYYQVENNDGKLICVDSRW